MANTPPAKTTLGDLLELLFRHKLKVIAIPAMVLGVGFLIAVFGPRTYRSSAKLCLQVGRESVNIDPTAATGQQMISLQQMGRESEITTAMDLMTSRGVVAQVVDRLGTEMILDGVLPDGEVGGAEAESNPVADALGATVGAAVGGLIATIKSIDPISDREEAIIEIEESFGVDAERDSVLIDMSYNAKTPAAAQRILQELIEVYQAEHLRIYRNAGSRAFFAEQEEQSREQLDRAMEALRLAKNEIGVASIDTRRTNLENQLQSITMAAFNAEAERQAAAAKLADINRQLTDTPERLMSSKREIPNEGADMLREQLYLLQVRQADLKARYSDSHPLVVAVSQQVEQAESVVDDQSSVREETTDDVNPIHRDLSLSGKQSESVVAGLDARLKMLRQQEAAVRQDLDKLNRDEVRLAQLEREKSIASRAYYRYTDSLEQARIDEELETQEISSISIAQAPTFAEKPVSPSKVLVGLGSMVLAFAGTAATLLGLEQLNNKLRTEAAVEEAVGVPVLASIPESSTHGRVLSK